MAESSLSRPCRAVEVSGGKDEVNSRSSMDTVALGMWRRGEQSLDTGWYSSQARPGQGETSRLLAETLAECKFRFHWVLP